MLINHTITKKILEKIIKESFVNLGMATTINLLDSLKILGFFYSTSSGISINIEDLKTPVLKKDFLLNAKKKILHISKEWKKGNVSDIERFQYILDNWNLTTDYLKNRIINYFEIFDPANSLYIMTFSGARGNISQIRQLIGMRGLMADQKGEIISLPIHANFREGLSSVDYVVSSYGARKGIVDTALKTASSGYLTRRLIYAAQDLIIKHVNCGTKKGVSLFLNKTTDIKDIIGRILISTTTINSYKINSTLTNLILSEKILNEFYKIKAPILLNVRSPLTCLATNSICQICYGLDIGKNSLVNLGEVVGIIAAHSIGEPGTQLTMRTFHTGGIFTSEFLNKIITPFSGYVKIPSLLKEDNYRTLYGKNVYKIDTDITVSLSNWKNIEKKLTISHGSFININRSSFIKKGTVLSESSFNSVLPTTYKKGAIYSPITGQVCIEEDFNQKKESYSYSNQKKKRREEKKLLWIKSGKNFKIQKIVLKIPLVAREFNILKFTSSVSFFNKNYQTFNPKYTYISKIWHSPCAGYMTWDDEYDSFGSKNIVISFIKNGKFYKNYYIYETKNFSENMIGGSCSSKLTFFVKKNEFVDLQSQIFKKEIFLNFPKEGKPLGLFSYKKDYPTIYIKKSKFEAYFLMTESDIWKINTDTELLDKTYLSVYNSGEVLTHTLSIPKSGFLVAQKGQKFVYHKAHPMYLTQNVSMKHLEGSFVNKDDFMLTILNPIQETQDIVQGLPKVEKLLEASFLTIKKTAKLIKNPGVYRNSIKQLGQPFNYYLDALNNISVEKKLLNYLKFSDTLELEIDDLTIDNEIDNDTIQILQTVSNSNNFILLNNLFYEVIPIPDNFFPRQISNSEISYKTQKTEDCLPYLVFRNGIETLKIKTDNDGILKDKWIIEELTQPQNIISFKFYSLTKTEKLFEVTKKILNIYKYSLNENNSIFAHDFIIEQSKNKFYFLKTKELVTNYIFDFEKEIRSKQLKPGLFLDIGEPISEGVINPHELLQILFNYHNFFDGQIIGTTRCLNKFQLIIINSIHSIYQSQGVEIYSKHFEIIIRQLTSRILIINGGYTPYLPGEIIRVPLILEILKLQKKINKPIIKLDFQPMYSSLRNCSLYNKSGFLASAAFQQTKQILTKAAIEGKIDWLLGLKERVIVGGLECANTTFTSYKYNLDYIHLFKQIKK